MTRTGTIEVKLVVATAIFTACAWLFGWAVEELTPLRSLLAEAGAPLDLVPGGAGTVSAVGVLAWCVWYWTTRTIPNLVSEFRAECREQREHAAKQHETIANQLVEALTSSSRRNSEQLDRLIELGERRP